MSIEGYHRDLDELQKDGYFATMQQMAELMRKNGLVPRTLDGVEYVHRPH